MELIIFLAIVIVCAVPVVIAPNRYSKSTLCVAVLILGILTAMEGLTLAVFSSTGAATYYTIAENISSGSPESWIILLMLVFGALMGFFGSLFEEKKKKEA